MAAAEGTVVLGPGTLEPRLGLTSVLLFRDRRSLFGRGAEPVVRFGGRAGEASREERGEAVVDVEPDTLSFWGRMGPAADAGAAGAGAGADALDVEAVGVAEAEVEGVVSAVEGAVAVEGVAAAAGSGSGSADSGAPVMERKASSSTMARDQRAWGAWSGQGMLLGRGR